MAERTPLIDRFLGTMLVAVGVLITLLSGTCTGLYTYMNVQEFFSKRHAFDIGSLFLILVIGLPFIIGGIALIRAGLNMARSTDRRRFK